MNKTLRLILGDQLNAHHSWWKNVDSEVLYVMMEIKPESTYVTHHIQKIVGIFQAMRAFAEERKSEGHHIIYFKIGDANNEHGFKANIERLLIEFSIGNIQYQEPDEYRLDRLLQDELATLGLPVKCVESEHFYTSRTEFKAFFKGKSSYVMEYFYRHMRRSHGILMEEGGPVGGEWNYDKENRKKLPKGHLPPAPLRFEHNVEQIYQEVLAADLPYIGQIDPSVFLWPKNREEAYRLLDYFATHLLIYFGTYQDALSLDYWSLYHSRLSFALNIKLISPIEVVNRIESEWHQQKENGLLSISQVEGFIRQILGWREYMRGIYWSEMPEFSEMNYFGHDRSLPQYFWSGHTKMNCIRHAVGQSLDYAYAHHIQRLMVTGNFALLAGVNPDEVDQWYLGIYIDAFEWVEITNTRGMSQYADGGVVGTKPYISSASYIHKMGNYCTSCHYNYKSKTGDKACPFNSFYWHFLDRHRELLAVNPRMSMMYRVWDKMNDKEGILAQAQSYLDHIEEL